MRDTSVAPSSTSLAGFAWIIHDLLRPRRHRLLIIFMEKCDGDNVTRLKHLTPQPPAGIFAAAGEEATGPTWLNTKANVGRTTAAVAATTNNHFLRLLPRMVTEDVIWWPYMELRRRWFMLADAVVTAAAYDTSRATETLMYVCITAVVLYLVQNLNVSAVL